jgi:hypothetical protein
VLDASIVMGRTVDRSFARMVALKRIVTGIFSIACGIGLIGLLLSRGSAPPIAGLAILIFFGGGAWMLRDGLRLRRELQQSS